MYISTYDILDNQDYANNLEYQQLKWIQDLKENEEETY